MLLEDFTHWNDIFPKHHRVVWTEKYKINKIKRLNGKSLKFVLKSIKLFENFRDEAKDMKVEM